VSALTHLDRYLTSNNDWTEQVQCRIGAAKKKKKAYFPLVRLLKTKYVIHENKKHSSDQLSASNTWIFSQNAVQIIDSFERNILRRIFGPAQNRVSEQTGSRGILNVSGNNNFQWWFYNIRIHHFIKSLQLSIRYIDPCSCFTSIISLFLSPGVPRKSHWPNLSSDSKRLSNTDKTHSAGDVHVC
jgi:hypothetical protein